MLIRCRMLKVSDNGKRWRVLDSPFPDDPTIKTTNLRAAYDNATIATRASFHERNHDS